MAYLYRVAVHTCGIRRCESYAYAAFSDATHGVLHDYSSEN